MVGSEQTFCGSCSLPNWRKQTVFDHNANTKFVCYDEKVAQLVWTNSDFCSDKQAAGIAVLEALAAEAGRGELRDTIIWERYRLPLDMMAGMTVDEAWEFIRGYEFVWRPPLAASNPYEARVGQTIPVKFRIEDSNGNFIRDNSVTIWIREVGKSGLNGLMGIVGVADDPNEGVKISNNQYHFNLSTDDFASGTYYLAISANSLPAEIEAERTIVLTD